MLEQGHKLDDSSRNIQARYGRSTEKRRQSDRERKQCKSYMFFSASGRMDSQASSPMDEFYK